jgi:hypothetical protein
LQGRRPDSMQQDANTYTFAFDADFAHSETRVITNGTVAPSPMETATDQRDQQQQQQQRQQEKQQQRQQEKQQPLLYFTTSRGGLRSAWCEERCL